MSMQGPIDTDRLRHSWRLAYAQMLDSDTGASTLPLNQERPSLLVVDDQATNIQVLNQIFREDHDVYMATSGMQALEVCRKHAPDLVLLDVVMPEMDGYEVCRMLKQDPQTADIPVIFVTSQDSAFEEARAFEEGGVDFIAKPVNPTVVRARVKAHLTIKAQSDLLKNMAFVDGLTGIPNRRYFDQQLAAEWNDARRHRAELSIIMIDVDHFKNYNDTRGHEQGDACLKAVAQALDATTHRGRDLVARYGGEEFIVMLPGTDIDGAALKAEQYRKAVEDLALPHGAPGARDFVSISLGVSSVVPNSAFVTKDLLKQADQQLYQAKSAGRNQVCARPLSRAS